MFKNIIGSKWWKFDFHSHTPASSDYGKGDNQKKLKEISPQEWLLSYMRQEVDCVAITDHNSGDWIDSLQQALKKLEDEKHAEYRPIWLFPGVELTVQGGVHILAIFDTDKKKSDIDSLLGAVRYHGTKGSSDSCTKLGAIEVIDTIIEYGGIAIPAHVNAPSGIFKEFNGTTLTELLQKIYVIESTDINYKKPEIIHSQKLNFTEVLGSDSHHLTGSIGQRFHGSHFTWVKMATPSLNGLRLALLDGKLSIKRSDEYSDNPNKYDHFIINYIKINKAKYLGRGTSLNYNFNPWLNTIIGGRGTGKSTTLEFLRIAFDRVEEIPKVLQHDFEKYSKVSTNRNDDGLLTEDTVITVGVTKDNIRFQLIWNQTEKSHTVKKETKDSEWNIETSNINQRFPIKIYSQKQIFELAKNPHALLKIIDDSPEIGFLEWKTEYDKLTTEFITLCIQKEYLKTELESKIGLQGAIDDITQKLLLLEKANFTTILQDFSRASTEETKINQQISLYQEFALELKKQLQDIPIPPPFTSLDEEKEDFQDFLIMDALLQIELPKLKGQILSLIDEIQRKTDHLNITKENWRITKSINDRKQKYHELIQELKKQDIYDSEKYESLLIEKQNLKEKLKKINETEKTYEKFTTKCHKAYEKIIQHRKIITDKRRQFLEKILFNNSYVKIEIIPYGNTIDVESTFRSILNTQSFERDIGNIESNEGLLSKLKETDTIEENLAEIKTIIKSLHKQESTYFNNVKDKRFAQYINSLPSENIFNLLTWFPDDSLAISYNIGKSNNKFQSIENGSPGQKTAALLAFILSYGEEPLILDQPEDDLDNYLIYDLIVQHLRNTKTKRQIIVVTHNANIVVNGDAEYIIILDIKSGLTRIIAAGSLQEERIRNEICKIMEGGKEAFEQRYRRIGFN